MGTIFSARTFPCTHINGVYCREKGRRTKVHWLPSLRYNPVSVLHLHIGKKGAEL
jgi:hypothetical protein